jgi:hypothetical protein
MLTEAFTRLHGSADLTQHERDRLASLDVLEAVERLGIVVKWPATLISFPKTQPKPWQKRPIQETPLGPHQRPILSRSQMQVAATLPLLNSQFHHLPCL